MLIIKHTIRKRGDMHSDVKELKADKDWRENKNWLSKEDALTVTAYCNMCKKDHRVAVIAITTINKTSVDIVMLSPTIEILCPNMRKDQDPIKLNFL